MRTLFFVVALMALSGCATLSDPNIETLTRSAEAQNAQITQIVAARETAKADAYAACINGGKSTPADCAVANLAMFGGGGGGSELPRVALPNYQRPPTPMEQFTGLANAGAPVIGAAINGAVNIATARENGRTQRVIAQTNAQRETAIVDAFARFGGNTVDAFARLPPTTVTHTTITAQGDLVQGDGNTLVRGQIGDAAGRDMAGRDVVPGVVNYGRDIRLSSPGPYVGPICTGDECQPTTPAPETDGE